MYCFLESGIPRLSLVTHRLPANTSPAKPDSEASDAGVPSTTKYKCLYHNVYDIFCN